MSKPTYNFSDRTWNVSCPVCDGKESSGKDTNGTHWECSCCHGAGKVSSLPPAYNIWQGLLPSHENGWTA
jgi:DnaJ-class molecular chaperone